MGPRTGYFTVPSLYDVIATRWARMDYACMGVTVSMVARGVDLGQKGPRNDLNCRGVFGRGIQLCQECRLG